VNKKTKMFQNQKMTTSVDNKKQPAQDFIAHTMQKDLAEINNPTLANDTSKVFPENNSVQPKNLTAQQKSSPFLNPTQPPAPELKINPLPIRVAAPTKNPSLNVAEKKSLSDELAQNPINTGDKPILSKPLIIIFAALIVLAIAGGTFYFWSTRQTAPVIVEAPIQEEVIPEPNPEPAADPEPVKPQYSTDKPNYLNIDIVNSDRNKLTEALNATAENILSTNLSTPVEFIISDLQNNPVSLTNFATKLELGFSQTILLNSAATFSVFLYNDQGKMHLALAIDAKNETALKNALRKAETLLETQIAPLFLDTAYTPVAGTFANSLYGKAAIRYKNIISPSELSIDYTVFNKKLLLGTTKMTLRSVIDYISAKAATPINSAKVPTDSTTAPELTQ